MWPWMDQQGPCPIECIVQKEGRYKNNPSVMSVVEREAQDITGACWKDMHMLSCVRETPHGNCKFCSFTKNVGTIPKRSLLLSTARLSMHQEHRVNIIF